ncbi:uncharacterized protein LOC132306062 [Cornus florida]|uniref:uncharacterized protein LOC132306062 n=1 Tax=Cornus florida TaxID=4283 RepID=UPI0028A1D263|nr:uncharacterized protein LOC132306062 [Cornus florida]
MTMFSEFIDSHFLVDLPLERAAFTWSNGWDPVTFSRLDRFLISGAWEEHFPDVSQAVLVKVTSDHVPLVLDCGGLSSRRTPFRFENMWLRSEDFQGKFLKTELKRWNKEVFGNLEWKKNRVFADIAKLNRLDEVGQNGESLHSKRASCQAVFAEIALMEEISWRQKSRALWLKDGDRNTKFFHRLANTHRRCNHIGRIRVNGSELWREDEVRGGIVSFYQQLYTETLGWRPTLDGLPFNYISALDSDRIEIPFMEEEVLKALSSCNEDKALGPDGFTIRFLKESWEVVRA